MSETSPPAVPVDAVKRELVRGALDVSERAVIVILYCYFMYGVLRHYWATHNSADILAISTESLIVLIVIARRPATSISLRLEDWVLAYGGTCITLLLRPSFAPSPVAPAAALLLQSVGLAADVWCKCHLFRNFGIAPALRGLTVKGPYALVRHPIYASYFISELGYVCAFPTVRNGAIIGIWAIAQVLRIFAEERVLGASPDYRAYMARVRWRLVPGLF